MIGFKKIIGGSASSVGALSRHLMHHTLSTEDANVSAYYHRGMQSGVDDVFAVVPDGTVGKPVAVVNPGIHPLAAEGLGIKIDVPLTEKEVNGLLAGRRSDGEKIKGKIYAKPHERGINPKTGERKLSTPIGSYDFCPSPDKSVSVAWAFAEPAERAMIYDAVLSASREAVAHIAERIGVAHCESNGQVHYEPGHVGILEFTHFTARRTKVGFDNDGILHLTDQELAGDPDLHVHNLFSNAVFCASGKIGSLHTGMIEGFIFAADGYFQSRLADKLLEAGFDVQQDPETGAARIAGVPELVRRVFSKRSAAGELIAREDAKRKGEDWDLLPPEERTARTRRAAHDYEQQRAKGGKDDVANFDSWRQQAARFNWTPPKSFMRSTPAPVLSDEQRHRIGYENALPFVAEKLHRKSVLTQWDLREAAGRGLVSVGAKGIQDINAVTQMMRDEGVEQDGQKTDLVWGHEPGSRHVSVTTELHEHREKRFIALTQKLAADRSGAIPRDVLDRTIADSGLKFEGKHGESLLNMIYRLGEGGRVAVAVAAAGAGKSSSLRPIVEAKKQLGWGLYGTSPAWRQADDLMDAGIPQQNIRAYSVLVDELASGKLKLGAKDLVAVDEISLLGTKPGLRLLEFADSMGFQVIALGDPKQCSALEAGSIIDLVKIALPGQVPEIVTTIRQQTDREKEIVGLLREGEAKQALDLKRSDGTAEMVPGDYDKVLARVAKLYMERLAETGIAPTASAPTNYDAHMVSSAIRKARRDANLVGPDVRIVKAGDNEGRHYGLALAEGDKVRLFKSTGGRFLDGKGGNIGRNGSVLEVKSVTDDGMVLKSIKTGRTGFVGWEALIATRGRSQGRVLLAYADCMTIHSAQGSTSAEHLLVLPAGSKAINGFQGYSAATRHQHKSTIVTSAVAERLEIIKRRPLNDMREVTLDDLWGNVARNIGYQPTIDLAVSMLGRVERVRRASTQRFQSSVRKAETGGQKVIPTAAAKLKEAASAASAQVRQAQQPTAAAQNAPTPSVSPESPRPPVETRSPNPTPQRQERPQMSPAEIQSEFADALKSIGLVLEGPAVMDGQKHQVKAIGGKQGKARANSGVYTGYSSGFGVGFNNRTGEKIEYRPSGGVPSVSPEERAARAEADRAARQAQQDAQRHKEAATADAAQRIWDGARLARADHPYLVAKDIDADGLRQAVKGQTAPFGGKEVPIGGRLLVPLRDVDGKLWNLQLIDGNGRKLFLEGRKKGLFFVAGELVDGQPKQIVEGVATAKSAYKLSLLTSVAAIDTSNLASVGADLRARFPNDALIYVTDNDHHLPRRDPPMPNAGVKYGEQAAEANRGVAVTPQFPAGDKGTDINDIWVGKGFAAARTALEQAYEAKGVRELLPPAPPPPPKRDAREVAWSKAKPQRSSRSTPHRQVPREDQRPSHKPGV